MLTAEEDCVMEVDQVSFSGFTCDYCSVYGVKFRLIFLQNLKPAEANVAKSKKSFSLPNVAPSAIELDLDESSRESSSSESPFDDADEQDQEDSKDYKKGGYHYVDIGNVFYGR
jgi:hypothetical protein